MADARTEALGAPAATTNRKFLKGSGGSKDDAQPTGFSCIRYGDLYTAHRAFVREAASYISPSKASQYTPLEAGDALFAASGETIDEIGKSVVNLLERTACWGGDVIVRRPQRPMVSSYLGYALDCRPVTAQKSLGGGVGSQSCTSAQGT